MKKQMSETAMSKRFLDSYETNDEIHQFNISHF